MKCFCLERGEQKVRKRIHCGNNIQMLWPTKVVQSDSRTSGKTEAGTESFEFRSQESGWNREVDKNDSEHILRLHGFVILIRKLNLVDK